VDADSRFVLHSLRRDPCLTLVRGENARLWDADGRMYLDTMSGSAGPAMVGHANPRVAEAVARQMATLPTTNILHQSDTLIAYCTRLAGLTPEGLTKVAVLAGGGEAIEAAIKLAMRVTGRTEVLSLHGAYHGMSLATMGLAGIVGDRAWLPGAVRWPTFRQVPNADTYRNRSARGPGRRPSGRWKAPWTAGTGRSPRSSWRSSRDRAGMSCSRPATTRRSSGPAASGTCC
jgi:4-aminobutyrate aminotransferase-like enzyme